MDAKKRANLNAGVTELLQQWFNQRPQDQGHSDGLFVIALEFMAHTAMCCVYYTP